MVGNDEAKNVVFRLGLFFGSMKRRMEEERDICEGNYSMTFH
jgi:hypothetical protein